MNSKTYNISFPTDDGLDFPKANTPIHLFLLLPILLTILSSPFVGPRISAINDLSRDLFASFSPLIPFWEWHSCLSEFDVPVPGIPGIGNFSFFGGIGTGIGKNWYRKKVSVPVSEKFGTVKKSRNRYRKNLVPEKSLGTGIGKIWYWKKSRSWNQYYLK